MNGRSSITIGVAHHEKQVNLYHRYVTVAALSQCSNQERVVTRIHRNVGVGNAD